MLVMEVSSVSKSEKVRVCGVVVLFLGSEFVVLSIGVVFLGWMVILV